MEENNPKSLFHKHGIKMSKHTENSYMLEFDLVNESISLESMIHFDLVTLIYELNKKDIFNNMKLDIVSDNHATIYMKMNHFFEDFGIMQKYLHVDAYIVRFNNTITFRAYSINPDLLIHKNHSTCELLEVSMISIECTIINPHKVTFTAFIFFEETYEVSDMIETMASSLFCKLLLRTKQCIEKMNFNV